MEVTVLGPGPFDDAFLSLLPAIHAVQPPPSRQDDLGRARDRRDELGLRKRNFGGHAQEAERGKAGEEAEGEQDRYSSENSTAPKTCRVIQLTYPDGWQSFHLPWAAMALAIMAFGPGRISLDWLLGLDGWSGRRAAA